MATRSFTNQLDDLQAVLAALRTQAEPVAAVTRLVSTALYQGRTLYTCGNGGSATDAIHLAQELVGRYRSDSARGPLPAVCLNADVGALTCIANDFGYAQVFARQLAGLAHPGDLLICFSTSGASPNIIAALEQARAQQVVSIALLGKGGGAASALADYVLVVPSSSTARIQEAHTLLLHAICEQVEADAAGPGVAALGADQPG